MCNTIRPKCAVSLRAGILVASCQRLCVGGGAGIVVRDVDHIVRAVDAVIDPDLVIDRRIEDEVSAKLARRHVDEVAQLDHVDLALGRRCAQPFALHSCTWRQTYLP